MATLIVNDKERRVQYTAAAAETNFTYDWSIFAAGDLDVFQQEIKLTLGVDYTVTGAGVTDGGEVILVVGATLNDDIVIVGDLAIDQTIDFTIKANFVGETVQTQFNKLTMISQELATKLDLRGLLYNVFDTLKENRQDNILPQLAANQFYQMNSTATGIFAAEFQVDPGANTLRAELISNQSGSDGAKIVGYFSPTLGATFVNNYLVRTESKTSGADGASVLGYFDVSDSTEKTIKAKLDDLTGMAAVNFKNLIIGGDFTINPVQRGSTFNPIVTNTFPADRFKYESTGSMVLKSSIETAGPPTLGQAKIFVNKYLRLEVTTGASLGVNDFAFVAQNIEGFNWTRIAQRKFTVSFFVRSSVTGTFAVSFRNTDKTISWVSNLTILAINTWEKKTVTVDASPAPGTWDYENGVGIEMSIVLAAGTNFQTTTPNVWDPSSDDIASTSQTNFVSGVGVTFDLALIQVEEGEFASSFEVRLFSEELAMCQRYFYKSYNLADIPGTPNTLNGEREMLVQNSGLQLRATAMTFEFPVQLRVRAANTNITVFSPVTGATGVVRNELVNVDAPSVNILGGENVVIVGTDAGGQAFNTNFTSHVTVNAEF